MAYFELYSSKSTSPEILISKLKSFRRNIQRDKILAKNRKASYLFFLSKLDKLVKLVKMKEGLDKQQRITKLENDITLNENVLLKFWLLKQAKKTKGGQPSHPPKACLTAHRILRNYNF